MRVLIFGAGASAGTLGLPAARDFGAELARARPRWRTRYPQLARVVEGLRGDARDGFDLGAAWTRLDYLTKLGWALGIDGESELVQANVEMRQALLEVYGQSEATIRRRLRDPRSQTVRHLLGELKPGDAIVSFNYDVVVEALAASIGLELNQAPCESCGASHRCVQLIKPHGSLAWSVERPAKRGKAHVTFRASKGRPLTRPLSPRNVNARRMPLVLGVVPIKSELLPEVQIAHEAREVHETIVGQWQAAVEAVRHADELGVVGYSFPPEDQYGSFLFYEAARARPDGPPRVEFYELEQGAFEVARRLLEVFGVWPSWKRTV